MEFPFKCYITEIFLLSGAPIIVVEPVETVVDAGTTVVLNCQAEGEPTPKIEWSHQGRLLPSNGRFSTLSNSSLRISSAQKEDTAEYECVARNLLGSVVVRGTLTVRGGQDNVGGCYCCAVFKSSKLTAKRIKTCRINVQSFVFQLMGATQSGQSGVLAAFPVVSVPKKG